MLYAALARSAVRPGRTSFYDEGSVAGRLRPGAVRSGDIYSLESRQEKTEVVEIRGSWLSPALLEALRARGVVAHPDRMYSVATSYVASKDSAKLGRIAAGRLRGRCCAI